MKKILEFLYENWFQTGILFIFLIIALELNGIASSIKDQNDILDNDITDAGNSISDMSDAMDSDMQDIDSSLQSISDNLP